MSTVGERIRLVRHKRCITQKIFGNALEVSQAHISSIEAGKDFPSKPLLALMSYRFSVNFKWLLDGSGYMGDVWKTPKCTLPTENTSQGSLSITINIEPEDVRTIAKRLAKLMKEIETEVS